MIPSRAATRKMRWSFRRLLPVLLTVVPALVYVGFLLLKQGESPAAEALASSSRNKKQLKSFASTCPTKVECPKDQFSFYMQTGAANVVAPKICVNNNLTLGAVMNNAGQGINVVVLDGKTGKSIKTGHFNMYSGEVKPLIELLQSVQRGAVVLIASFDDVTTKLNDEAKELIVALGSSVVKSLHFRDNWLFVGGKGGGGGSNFEKYLKNDGSKNKYEGWPELIDMQGCIPKFLE